MYFHEYPTELCWNLAASSRADRLIRHVTLTWILILEHFVGKKIKLSLKTFASMILSGHQPL